MPPDCDLISHLLLSFLSTHSFLFLHFFYINLLLDIITSQRYLIVKAVTSCSEAKPKFVNFELFGMYDSLSCKNRLNCSCVLKVSFDCNDCVKGKLVVIPHDFESKLKELFCLNNICFLTFVSLVYL